ncbi:unnamed protein product [Ixodes hexagonus]
MEVEVAAPHSVDSHSRELNVKVKNALRVAKSENSMPDVNHVVTRIQRKQVHTRSVRDLKDAAEEQDPTREGRKASDAVPRATMTRPKQREREILPGLSIEAIERSVPVVALTLAAGAFALALFLLGHPGGGPDGV